MTTAFQVDSFQSDSFQIDVVVPVKPTGSAIPFFRHVEPQLIPISDEAVIEVRVVRHLSRMATFDMDSVALMSDVVEIGTDTVRAIADVYGISCDAYAFVDDSCEGLYDIVDTLLSEGHIEIKTLDSVLVKLKKANLAFDDDLLLMALKKRMVR